MDFYTNERFLFFKELYLPIVEYQMVTCMLPFTAPD